MNLYIKTIGAVFIFLYTTVCFSSNFTYTDIGIEIGRVDIDEPFIFNGYLVDELGYAGLQGNFQVSENAFFSIVSGSMFNSSSDNSTEISYRIFSLSASFPIAVSDSADIIPMIGIRNDEVEFCISSICAKADEDATQYGIAFRTWLVRDHFDLTISYLDADSNGFSSEKAVEGTVWFNDHSQLTIKLLNDDDLRRFALGYRYTWK